MQREKQGVTIDQLTQMVGQRPTYLSGGQIEGFHEGWAHNIMGSGSISHYYKRNRFDAAVSLCGTESALRSIYGAGNYPRCKKCQRSMNANDSH
jgi:hypothetical protein